MKILDVGAGTGLVGEELKRLGWVNLTGVDLSEDMLHVAASKRVRHSPGVPGIVALYLCCPGAAGWEGLREGGQRRGIADDGG